jgi:glycosyltransferase involved in cell wall biosynthesis
MSEYMNGHGENLKCNVCAIVPLYNEADMAGKTINSLLEVNSIDEIVAVDDGSTDSTWEIISSIDGIIKLKHQKNMGKAEAVKHAIKICHADIYVFVDGDIGESASNISHIIDEVLSDNCDMCIAGFHESDLAGGFGLLRSFSRFAVHFFTGCHFPCPLSGQRAVKSKVIHDPRVKLYHGYGLETGMLIDSMLAGYRVGLKYVDLNHNVTYRNLKGFIHRAKQFADVASVFVSKLLG